MTFLQKSESEKAIWTPACAGVTMRAWISLFRGVVLRSRRLFRGIEGACPEVIEDRPEASKGGNTRAGDVRASTPQHEREKNPAQAD